MSLIYLGTFVAATPQGTTIRSSITLSTLTLGTPPARSPTVTSSAPAASSSCGFKPVGCYADSDAAHALQINIGAPSTTQDTTQENCQVACSAQGYAYSGTTDGYKCFCDDSVVGKTELASYCNVACFGSASEMCGGYDAMSIFHNACITPKPRTTSTVIVTAPAPTPTPTTVATTSKTPPGGISTVTITVPYSPIPTIPTTSVIHTTSPPPVIPPTTTRAPGRQTTTDDTGCDWWNPYCVCFGPRCKRSPATLLAAPIGQRGEDHSTISGGFSFTLGPLPTGSSTIWAWPSKSYSTSTIYKTTTYTITSCAPSVTLCPASTTTTSIFVSTTLCEITPASSVPVSTIPLPAASSTVAISVPTVSYGTTSASIPLTTSASLSLVVPAPSSSSSSPVWTSSTNYTASATVVPTPSPTFVQFGAASKVVGSFALVALAIFGGLIMI